MKNVMKLTAIGVIAGIFLAAFLKFIQLVTNNQAYNLLLNTDYIPLLNELHPKTVIGFIFHFVTCVASVVILFYLLKIVNLSYKMMPYIIVYTLGSSILFPLTALSERTPALSDYFAWLYWVLGHALYSLFVAIMIKKWM